MKKAFRILTIAALFIISNQSQAKIFRIGFPGTGVLGVDYKVEELQTAVNNAAAGDTIQLHQQYWSTSTNYISVTKKLIFIGFGYMLDENSGLQAVKAKDQMLASLFFAPGAQGSVVQGVYGQISIATNDMTLTRSRITVYLGHNPFVGVVEGVNNITITSNYLTIQEYSGSTNLNISNNIFYGAPSLGGSTGLFSNNIVSGGGTYYSFLVKNNIFSSCPNANSSVVEYNLFEANCSSSIVGIGNQFNVDMSTVFQFWNPTYGFAGLFYKYEEPAPDFTDKRFTLKSGSPAIGAGRNNSGATTDIGVFGGEPGYAYRLSGIPAVPSIYKLTAASSEATTNPYTITVSVRSNN